MSRRGVEVTVNGYSERWLRKGFPWVYPKEVVGGAKVRPGSPVLVRGPAGEVLGRGLADDGWIAVRVFRHDGGPLDTPWMHARLDQAAALREQVVDPGTTGYRLVHGECDGIPGVRIDWWGHYAVIVLDSPSLAPLLEPILSWLRAHRDPRGVYCCYRPDHRDPRRLDEWTRPAELIDGHAPTDDVRVTERGLSFLVRPPEGPDVGLYTDMREVRGWLEPHWAGRSVLNTFAYTGAFSVAAAAHGASEVVTVDLSSKILDRVERNLAANELDLGQHELLASDTFKILDRFRRKDRRFDLIVLDPPSFSRATEGIWSAKRDWPRLVASACRVLEPGGWLVVASNQGDQSPKTFRGLMTDGLAKADRHAQELWNGSQGPDYPAASWFPEGRYLKVTVWKVL